MPTESAAEFLDSSVVFHVGGHHRNEVDRSVTHLGDGVDRLPLCGVDRGPELAVGTECEQSSGPIGEWDNGTRTGQRALQGIA
ncbi:hypothetical protein [Nocardia sp. NPDC005366]|uniref:hypothetical protein n=1 Tax=Nocardia sp. NPDC005366 TaxID=3156878 RepID=UPI00339FCCDC